MLVGIWQWTGIFNKFENCLKYIVENKINTLLALVKLELTKEENVLTAKLF